MDNKNVTTMVNYYTVHVDKFFFLYFFNVGGGFNVLQFKIKKLKGYNLNSYIIVTLLILIMLLFNFTKFKHFRPIYFV